MRNLLACTAIAPVLAALSVADAAAETTIGSSTTTAVRTSTVANGAADDVTVSSAGSLTLTGGTAITQDTNNKVANAHRKSLVLGKSVAVTVDLGGSRYIITKTNNT